MTMGVLQFCVVFVFVSVVNSAENITTIANGKNEAVTIITVHDNKQNESVLRAARDTYLEAYASSHGGAPIPKKQITSREEKYPPADFYPKPQNDYGSPIYTNEQPKVMNHGYNYEHQQPTGPGYPYNPSPPSANYGSPQNSYGPPASGPPNNMYGPPAVPVWPAPVYGPPSPAYGPPPSDHSFLGGIEMPHSMMGLLDKFKLKLNMFTILKIILKLVIFKKIIKFIAILCLLLFIPQFKPKEMTSMMEDDPENDDSNIMMNDVEDDGMMRNLSPYYSNAEKRLNMLTAFVHNALATYSSKQFDKIEPKSNSNSCKGFFCKVQTILNNVDKKFTFGKLFTTYYRNEVDVQS